ncbi:hypothetical protein RHSIM_Rhsim13G0134200 [Rhododendron simsii]|uniref:Aminotransferase-like plant mobile domain-containing protein n=1 Tax=Rhododendron simsii TaxID=118357 RepID=A0A834L4A1_RHOSS|nr:hypothetical protein RHSIM_RhsimUnG0177100 [Rhododendron simsii]KAF7120995.1 hypothetical protein RHSIM_Rhsim13G0134200 [Rhododendron simsii]
MDLNLNELRSPDPGPRDGSILRLQHQHHSREVWEADVSDIWIIARGLWIQKKVKVRSAKKCIRALPRPSPPVLELIRRARLEGLCSLLFVSVDWGLITELLERWRSETHTFHLRPGESTITLQDVEVLLGIPVEGKPVTGNTNLKARDLCKHLLGEYPTEESYINGMKVKASWLSDRFTGQVEEGADPEVVACQARGYLLLLMGETIFADHSGGYVHLANLERLENFDEAGTYSWGSGALDNLYHNLCHGCKVGTKQITCCFILLQVWAWERLPYLAPGRLGKRAPKTGAPLIGRWDDVFHSPDLSTHLVGTYRYHLDIQRPDEVIWTPYSEELLESLPEYCRAGRAVWRASVPLIYYVVCQYHQPERVMRQFGFRQCIPPSSCSLDPPHGKTLQSGALDWALKYQKIIEVWNNRLNLVVPPGDIDLLEYPFDDPYVAWYDRIIRRGISCVGCGVDGVARCLKALNMLGVPAPYRDVALAGLMHMGVFEKFLRLQPPQHGVFKGNQELGQQVVESIGGGGSSSQTCSHSEVPWEQLEVVGFGASTLSHDSLVQAKRRRIDESRLGDVGGSVGDGDITQVGVDTQDLHVDQQHEAEVELDFVSNNDGQDDEVEEEANFQDLVVGGDIEGEGEVTLSTTKTPVVAQRRTGMPATVMKITYPFPIMSYPHATYQYAAVDVVDDSSIGIMFDISDKIIGYTPLFFTETMDAMGSLANESVVHHRSSHQSQRQSQPNISQHRRNDSTFIENEENFEDVDEEPIIHEKVYDDITDIGAFEMHLRDIDEASQSSEEDVDALLEANEGEQDPIRMFEKPSTMMTQDTWTNFVNPSPPMPTSSHVGWDGRSVLFEGQLAMRYIVRDIFQATGRHWHLDDDFEYLLNPNMRYAPIVFREMQREYQCRLEQYEVLKFDCQTFNIPIPRCRAVDMPIDTPQLLQRVLHRFLEEVNRMQMCLQRHQYRFLANERRDEGLMGEARFYMEASMNEYVQSDIEMSDEDQEP